MSETQNRRTRSAALCDLGARLNEVTDLDHWADVLVRGLVDALSLTHGTLLLHDSARGTFVPLREEIAIGNGLGLESIRAEDPLLQRLPAAGRVVVKGTISAALILPLRIGAELLGLVVLGDTRSGERLDAQTRGVLAVLAAHAALALRTARLADADRLRSLFFARMSHDLRSPLNSIIGFAKLLLRRVGGDLTEKQQRHLQSLLASGLHLLQLVNNLIDISRLDAAEIEIARDEIDPGELVAKCVELSRPLVRGKPITIEQEIIDATRFEADRAKVQQILQNLLDNAVKFTSEGRVTIRVMRDADAIHFSVTDTGVGISEPDLQRLLRPRSAFDDPRAGEGQGLGLTISRRFVELQGGRLWAESHLQHGSTVHFTLPLMSPPG